MLAKISHLWQNGYSSNPTYFCFSFGKNVERAIPTPSRESAFAVTPKYATRNANGQPCEWSSQSHFNRRCVCRWQMLSNLRWTTAFYSCCEDSLPLAEDVIIGWRNVLLRSIKEVNTPITHVKNSTSTECWSWETLHAGQQFLAERRFILKYRMFLAEQ